MKLAVIRDVAEAERLAPRWRELLGRATLAEPVSTPTWMLTWWREFGGLGGRELRLVTVEDEGVLVGLVPLCARTVLVRRIVPVRRLELLATGEPEEDEICSDYVGAVVARGREAEVARAFAAALREGALGGWDELVLPTMSGDDPFPPLLQDALAPLVARVSLERSGSCPHIPLPASWEEYTKRLDGDRRYLVVRSLRELEKWAGKDHELRRASTPAELEEGKRVLRVLHGERWEDKGKKGVFASARFTRFHDTIMARLFEGTDGALDLLWLTVQKEPIAALYNIVYGNKVYFYQSGRKLDVPKGFRPGFAAHALAIQRSIALGHREYDFLAGMSQYKMKLSLETRPLVTLRATAAGVRARTLLGAIALAERAVRTARAARNPRPSRPPPQEAG